MNLEASPISPLSHVFSRWRTSMMDHPPDGGYAACVVEPHKLCLSLVSFAGSSLVLQSPEMGEEDICVL